MQGGLLHEECFVSTIDIRGQVITDNHIQNRRLPDESKYSDMHNLLRYGRFLKTKDAYSLSVLMQLFQGILIL
jgi:hypothetical protein